MRYRRILFIALATALVLTVPLFTMQGTAAVQWTVSDFVVAGLAVLGAGISYEFIARKGGTLAYKAAASIALATVCFCCG